MPAPTAFVKMGNDTDDVSLKQGRLSLQITDLAKK